MPLYSYECEYCGKQNDKFSSVAERHSTLECQCGGAMKKVIACGFAHSDIDILTDDIDGTMRRITSKKVLKNVMRDAKVVERFGQGWF